MVILSRAILTSIVSRIYNSIVAENSEMSILRLCMRGHIIVSLSSVHKLEKVWVHAQNRRSFFAICDSFRTLTAVSLTNRLIFYVKLPNFHQQKLCDCTKTFCVHITESSISNKKVSNALKSALLTLLSASWIMKGKELRCSEAGDICERCRRRKIPA